MKLEDMNKKHVIFLTDVDADTLDVSQMKPVAYTEFEGYAKEITDFLNKTCDEREDMPCRKYNYIELL